MAVFFTAASYYKQSDFAKNPQKQTACQLCERVELPYFKLFGEERLSLEALCALIDEQVENCLAEAGWQKSELGQIPIFLGSTGYVIADCEARLLANQPLPEAYSLAVIANTLSKRYQTQVFSFATSCTSSAQGIYSAYQMIAQGLYDKALVIGFEPFNRLTFEHFHAMHLLSPNDDYRPFQQADGMVLGEGLACLALSRQGDVEICGISCHTDHESLTNNSETALDALITQVLEKSAVSSEQISWIKPHAVGGNFDETELALLQRRFPQAECFPLKANIGHTLGASGAEETALLLEILQKNQENRPLAGYGLCYFLGFGGSNVGFVIKW